MQHVRAQFGHFQLINLKLVSIVHDCIFLFYHGATAPPSPPTVGQGLLIIEASRSPSDTPHSVGLLWTSDQLVAETSTSQHTTDRHPPMPPAGFEPTIQAGERPHTHALDRAATGIYDCIG
jgi:hypothetical protein